MEATPLTPSLVFEHFARINGIPRPSKHEEKMIDYLVAFGHSRHLETKVDATGNVLIRKRATPGYESARRITLQSHMDMVCDKLVDKEIDFLTDPIETYIDGDWLKARGTTLGADDGIGCAIELALLDSDDVCHGPLECLFTRDEETGLTGAEGMAPGFITGEWLINLDSEDFGQLFVSCAGGRTTEATFSYTTAAATDDQFFAALQIKGLFGGHSGDDIHRKRANAIKLMARFLYGERQKMLLQLCAWDSGSMHNAIPREGRAVIAIPQGMQETLRKDWNIFTAQVQEEFHVTEQAMEFIMESAAPQRTIEQGVSDRMIAALQAVANGVLAMCQDKDIEWLVETSSNIASIHTTATQAVIVASQRSSVMSNLDNMCATVRAAFELARATVIHRDGYPAWKRNAKSELTRIAVETYKTLFNAEPQVMGIHAGLECGLFAEKYPELDMISLGPTLRHVHTPQEKLFIPSVQKVWDHLRAILQAAR